MGKGNRSRTLHATEIISSSTNKKTDADKKTNRIIVIVSVLVALLIIAALGLNYIQKYGILERGKKAVTSENYEITGTMLSYYVYSYYNSYYSSYASYLGIETGYALEDQAYEEGSDITWFDYFAYALSSQLKQTLALCESAKGLGISLDDSDKADIESAMDTLEETAAKYGYSTSYYIQAMFGTGVSYSDVKKAMEYSTLASKVSEKINDDFENEAKADEEAINKYYNDNPASFLTADTLQYVFTATLTTADAEATTIEKDNYAADKNKMLEKAELIKSAAVDADSFKAAVADYLCNDKGPDLFESQYKSAVAAVDEANLPSADELANIQKQIIDYCKAKMTDDAAVAPDFSDKAYSSAIATVQESMLKTLVTEGYKALDKDDVAYSDPTSSSATELNKWLFDSERKDGDVTVITSEGDTTSTYTVVFVKSAAHRDETITKNAAHILIAADGTTIAYDDGSTDAASAAAKTKAEEILATFTAGEQTLDAFKKLSEGNTADSGCEYTNIKEGEMVTEFENWVYDSARKAGDTGIVKTSYGYHVMYFIGDGEPVWKVDAISGITSKKLQDWYEAAYEKYNITINEKIIKTVD